VRLRPYGAGGLAVSPLGLGGGALGGDDLDDGEVERLLDAAFERGVDQRNAARSYGGAEARIGRWLRRRPGQRDRVVLSTKGGYGIDGVADWTPAAVARAVDEALVRLATDRIELFHLHSCPLETLRAHDLFAPLEAARAAGKIGVVAYAGDNEALAHAVASGRVGGVICSLNPFDQAVLGETLPAARAAGLGVVIKRALGNAPWRPGARLDEAGRVYLARMQAMGFQPAPLAWDELALRFSAHAPGVAAVLVGTRTISHLLAAADAVERGPLAPAVADALRAAFARLPGAPRAQI
jgi:aryl-alcohol dehydrogenase-like predicted oxidoreductase